MKNKTKKIVSAILAFVLCFAMLLPATSGITLVAEASEYVGDWGVGHFIEASEFENFDGDIVLHIGYSVELNEENPWPQFALINDPLGDADWVAFEKEDYKFLEYDINEWNYITVPVEGADVTVILKETAAEELAGSEGLVIQVSNGFIVEYVEMWSAPVTSRTVPLDSAYPEVEEGESALSSTISAAELAMLPEGPVAVTLDYKATGNNEYPWFKVLTGYWTELTPKGNVSVTNGEGTITFVLEEEDIAAVMAESGLMFQYGDVYFTQAVFTAAEKEDYYAGDWNAAYTFTASELAELDSTKDVLLTIEYTTLDGEGYKYPCIQLTNMKTWTHLTTEDFADETKTNDWDCIDIYKNNTTKKMTISAAALEELVESGGDLAIRGSGVIVKSASLEVVEKTEIILDATYPEADENGDVLSPVIPAEAFEAFDGAVAITLDYKSTGDLEYPWYNVFTCGWTKLSPAGHTNVTNDGGTITLVLSESDVAAVIAHDGLMLQLGGVYFTQAVLTEATPDDYYVGDYNIAHEFEAEELSSYKGDVTLNVEYTTVSEGYDWPFIQLTDLSDWSNLMTDDFADGTEANEYACIGVDVAKNEMTIVIKEDVIQAIAAAKGGLAVRVFGVMVQSASLKGEGLVGSTGNIEVDDTSSSNGLKWVILPDGVPEDGQIHFITYEIYDETNTLLGVLEYRAGNNTWPNIWITVDGVSEDVYADYDSRTEPHVLITGHWDKYFPEEDYNSYRQYTYKVTGDAVLTEQISNVETISWDTAKAPGWLTWEPVEGAGGYHVDVWRDGHTSSGWTIDPSQGTTLNVADCINESGTYTVSIATYGGKDTLDSDEEILLEYVYTRPEVEVGAPNKIWWTTAEDSEVPTVAHWNPVAGAKGYEVRIEAYDAANPDGGRVDYIGFTDYNTETTLTCSRDFAWQINALNDSAAERGVTYVYKVAVRALSGNIELVANALNQDTFVSSGEYKAQEAIAQEIADEVMMKLASGEDIGAVVDKWGKDEFGDAMKYNASLWEMLADAEQYSGITVSDTVIDEALGLDAGSVDVLGAGLNAASGTVGLVIEEAEEKIDINKELYHNAMQMDITLHHEDTNGATTIRELDVPMAITMPAPDNIEPERLVILHEHEGVVEPIYPEYNAEDDTITFPVTGFSTFAVAGITLYDIKGKETKEYESDTELIPEDDVTSFVSRLYSVILGREADEAGLAEWTGYLENGDLTGAQVAKGFIMSDEFLNKDMSNDEFVQILYSAFFGREADPDGLTTWVNFLNEGYRKSFIFAGFANSNEFAALCEGYGVAAGSVPVTISEQQPNLSDADYNVWLFVERMYTEVLGRTPDMLGIQEWVNYLKAGTYSGAEVASGFILSSEFQAKEMTNEEYVQIMYKAFFGREADPSGLETWVNALETSFTKEYVFAGFANSNEFGVLCANYGILQGSVEVPEK